MYANVWNSGSVHASMGLCGTLGLASKELLPGYFKEVFGSSGLQEESPQSWKITRRFTRLQNPPREIKQPNVGTNLSKSTLV